jgi:predicted nucleic acid-binding protein
MSEFFQRPVVCNTSPVISLCKAGLGHLLVALFPKVVTSTAVAAELRAKDAGDSAEIENVLSAIEILPAPPLHPMVAAIFDPG